ncbi:hypothetical protein F5H01DRAFT_328453 [Linnemannia elongata]|nr:hypothetical protein F5H01DRAFT_328453 [Linnemannia elongata]
MAIVNQESCLRIKYFSAGPSQLASQREQACSFLPAEQPFVLFVYPCCSLGTINSAWFVCFSSCNCHILHLHLVDFLVFQFDHPLFFLFYLVLEKTTMPSFSFLAALSYINSRE